MSDLNFLGNDPGAVKYGNFINYYDFNTTDRVKMVPKNLLNTSKKSVVCLDIGCNSGVLTQALFEYFSSNASNENNETKRLNISGPNLHILGIDLDPVLIERAQNSNKYPQNITYECLDISRTSSYGTLCAYLTKHNVECFDITFCFSVIMWIHLNIGDVGLKEFLVNISKLSEVFIVEPQPWKCYRNAVKRLKRAGGNFPMFDKLAMRENVEFDIDEIIINDCGLVRASETVKTNWNRNLYIYKREWR